ncbi:MAG: glycosyltransferase family 2 protein [Candidatus Zixiibacteriota bacterium]
MFPNVSIILAIRNEAEHLDDCLRALINLDYPKDNIEILLVDGMSDDATPEIVATWGSQDRRIRALQNPKRSVSCGMNIGLEAAKSEHILWVSGHAILQPGHIKQCLAAMERTGASAVGGVLTTRGTTVIGKINAAVLSHPFGVGGGAHRIGGRSGWVKVVTMALYRKEAIVAAGGFDESLPRSQDNDLHHRMNKLGLRSYLDVEINPEYLCRSTLRGMLRQAWNNGYWNIVMTRRGHGGFSPRHYVPIVFVGGQVLLLIIALIYKPALTALGAALAVYIAGAIIASVSAAIKNRMIRQTLLLPLWFAALHYTYGLASLAGLLKPQSSEKDNSK